MDELQGAYGRQLLEGRRVGGLEFSRASQHALGLAVGFERLEHVAGAPESFRGMREGFRRAAIGVQGAIELATRLVHLTPLQRQLGLEGIESFRLTKPGEGTGE